jgi:hypothetical protein
MVRELAALLVNGERSPSIPARMSAGPFPWFQMSAEHRFKPFSQLSVASRVRIAPVSHAEDEYATVALLTDQLANLASLPPSNLLDSGLCRDAGPGTDIAGALTGRTYSEGFRIALWGAATVAVKVAVHTRASALPTAYLSTNCGRVIGTCPLNMSE